MCCLFILGKTLPTLLSSVPRSLSISLSQEQTHHFGCTHSSTLQVFQLAILIESARRCLNVSVCTTEATHADALFFAQRYATEDCCDPLSWLPSLVIVCVQAGHVRVRVLTSFFVPPFRESSAAAVLARLSQSHFWSVSKLHECHHKFAHDSPVALCTRK